MCNVSIAKSKLKTLKSRTEKDLYLLKYESIEFMQLTDETFSLIKKISKQTGIKCPIFKYGGEFKIKEDVYLELDMLASEHQIVLDIKKITNNFLN